MKAAAKAIAILAEAMGAVHIKTALIKYCLLDSLCPIRYDRTKRKRITEEGK